MAIAACFWLSCVAAACVACGGRSESSPDSGESTRTEGSSGSGDPTSTDNDDDGLDDDLELGECVEGWAAYEGECPWQGSDHLCYATKAEACACLCPRHGDSTCVSGLPGGPDSQVPVSCF